MTSIFLQRKHRPSADFKGSSSKNTKKAQEHFEATAGLLNDDQNIVHLIECYIFLFFPELYVPLKRAYNRGAAWVKSKLPPGSRVADGVFLGRVTLYKLQTQMHRDELDLLCAIFCAGEFDGGEAIFPDLNAKLK